jgi:hypothetical protein
MARLGRHHAVTILISDFIDCIDPAPSGARASTPGVVANKPRFERALELVRRRNDVIPVRVEDPLELELPALGLVAIEDLELLEQAGISMIDFGGKRAKQFRDEVARERAAFDALMRRLRLDTISITCGEASDWQQPLIAFFERRARRMRR